jgi:AraC-like DNA-binding protein
LLFISPGLAIGSHRLPADHPHFESYGPASSFLFVFPRNSTLIERDGETVVGSPAISLLYNRGQEYRRGKISEEGDHCDWFAVDPDLLRELVAAHDPRAADSDRPLRNAFVPVDPAIYLRQRQVLEHVSSSATPDSLFVEETMLGVFARLIARGATRPCPEAVPGGGEHVQRACAVLSATFTRNWSLARIARESGISPFHLARSFKRAMGVSMHQHRLTLRLHASLEKLREPKRDLSAVAHELGFADHSHFTAAFRRRFGVTPSRYRSAARFS